MLQNISSLFSQETVLSLKSEDKQGNAYRNNTIIITDENNIITRVVDYERMVDLKGRLTTGKMRWSKTALNCKYNITSFGDYISRGAKTEIRSNETGKLVKIFDAFYGGASPDGRYILLLSDNGCEIADAASNFTIIGICGINFNNNKNPAPTFLYDSKFLVYIGGIWKNELNLYSIAKNKVVNTIKLPTNHSGLEYLVSSPNSYKIAYSIVSTHIGALFSIIDLQTSNVETYQLSNNSYLDQIYKLGFSPDGKYVAEYYWANNIDRKTVIYFWDVNSVEIVKKIVIPEAENLDFAFSPDGQYFGYSYQIFPDFVLEVIKVKSFLPKLINYTKAYQLISSEREATLEKTYNKLIPKNEFETSDDYIKRVDYTFMEVDSLRKYFSEKLNEEYLAIENKEQNEFQTKSNEIENKITQSIKETTLNIDAISPYDADIQTFRLQAKGNDLKVVVPISEAPGFKEIWKQIQIKCKMKLKYDLKNWEYYDFIVVNPNTGKEYPAIVQ